MIKKLISFSLFLILSALPLTASMKAWETDYHKAFSKALETKKPVLVLFTGSDWCPPCMQMEKNVFSKPSFIEEASKHVILLVLDFPNKDPELKKNNTPFAKTHKIQGFPTVLILSPEKKELKRDFASSHPTIKEFLEFLKTSLPK